MLPRIGHFVGEEVHRFGVLATFIVLLLPSNVGRTAFGMSIPRILDLGDRSLMVQPCIQKWVRDQLDESCAKPLGLSVLLNILCVRHTSQVLMWVCAGHKLVR